MNKQLIIIMSFGVFLILIILLVFRLFFFKENESIVKYSKLNSQKKIAKGEWISNLDSSSGISIRENKIAFFKNMEFTSDDIYEYQIIDSIHENDEGKIKVGEFLMMEDSSDTIYYQILKKNDTSLTLKINKNKTEIFRLKASKK